MNTIRALLSRPGFEPEVKEIENSLESLQSLVNGYIEMINPYDEDVVMIVNEEGKVMGLPVNHLIFDDNGRLLDALVGNIVVAGIDEDGDTVSLSDTMQAKYLKLLSR